MYCRWELQEDCSDLQSLMERFDSVAELQSHDLGRSLLFMVQDEGDDFRAYFERRNAESVTHANTDAFDAVRASLAAVDIAFQGLQPQVHILLGFVKGFALPTQLDWISGSAFVFCHSGTALALIVRHCGPKFLIQYRVLQFISF